jgi:hypothetical protein
MPVHEHDGDEGRRLVVRPGDEGYVVDDDSPISFVVCFPDAST